MKVTVIVPAFNAEKYIERCLKSILDQSLRDIEVIVIDDGSFDQTGAICQKISKQDERLIVIHQKNQGVAKARNHGLACAKGDYVTFVDADDYLEKECLKIAYGIICHADIDIVLWDLCNIYENGKIKYHKPIIGSERLFEFRQISDLEFMMLSEQSESGDSVLCLSGPFCKLIKTKLAQKCYFPDNISLGEDTCFVLQLFQKSSKIKYISKCFYRRCVYSDSLSMNVSAETANRMAEYVNWVCDFFDDKDKKNIIDLFCFQRYQAIVLYYFFSDICRTYSAAKNNIKKYFDLVNYNYSYSKIRKKYKIVPRVVCFLITKNILWPLYLSCKIKKSLKCL